jgi:hypothetical protein
MVASIRVNTEAIAPVWEFRELLFISGPLVVLQWDLGTIAGLWSGPLPDEIQRPPLPGCLEAIALKSESLAVLCIVKSPLPTCGAIGSGSSLGEFMHAVGTLPLSSHLLSTSLSNSSANIFSSL